MIDDVLFALACPHCTQPLHRFDGVIGCDRGHRFDQSRRGYLSLLGRSSRTDTGDTAEMVAARLNFLNGGHYAPIAWSVVEAVRQITAPAPPGVRILVAEVGAGTAYYLAAALHHTPLAVGLALDASPHAARRAVSAHPWVGSVVADAWSTLPILDGAVDVALSVFAPRNPDELSRILAKHGGLVIVTPNADHLAEVITPLGMLRVGDDKDDKLAAAMAPHFRSAGVRLVRFTMYLSRADLRELVLMGPAARHVDLTELDAAVHHCLPITAVTASVSVSVWHPH